MLSLGIDLGGTFARAAVVDEKGTVVSHAKIALSDRGPGAVVDSISSAVSQALSSAHAEVAHCGIGVAAQLGDEGKVLVAPNLKWRDVPFGELLRAKLRRPVRVMNDLVAATWGEFRAGAGRGVQDIWVVFVGSGVGSAVVSAGRLVRGATGIAGEFGHIKVVPDGRLCGCGERGCLEAYAGGHNLIAQMKEALDASAPTALRELIGGDPTQLSPALLEQAAEAQDAVARSIYQPAMGYLAQSIANQVTLLNPARVILGGGVLEHAPGIKRIIRETVATLSSVNSRAACTVVDAMLGDDSGIVGAGLLAAESA